MMSGLTMGISVTVFMAARYQRERRRLMPTAAKVPSSVEIAVADAARTSVFFSAASVLRSRKSSTYHFTEKSEKTERLLASLKEKTSRTAIGAKRKQKMIAL